MKYAYWITLFFTWLTIILLISFNFVHLEDTITLGVGEYFDYMGKPLYFFKLYWLRMLNVLCILSLILAISAFLATLTLKALYKIFGKS
jgi:hypothetical protein